MNIRKFLTVIIIIITVLLGCYTFTKGQELNRLPPAKYIGTGVKSIHTHGGDILWVKYVDENDEEYFVSEETSSNSAKAAYSCLGECSQSPTKVNSLTNIVVLPAWSFITIKMIDIDDITTIKVYTSDEAYILPDRTSRIHHAHIRNFTSEDRQVIIDPSYDTIAVVGWVFGSLTQPTSTTTATFTPTSTFTPIPTKTPTQTATATLESTPVPTNTNEPTATFMPTVTPLPTAIDIVITPVPIYPTATDTPTTTNTPIIATSTPVPTIVLAPVITITPISLETHDVMVRVFLDKNKDEQKQEDEPYVLDSIKITDIDGVKTYHTVFSSGMLLEAKDEIYYFETRSGTYHFDLTDVNQLDLPTINAGPTIPYTIFLPTLQRE